VNHYQSVLPSTPAARPGSSRRNRWLLIGLLLIAALVLAGCGVPREGADVVNTAPEGWWQTLVVWPLAKALIWLDDLLIGMNVPYHWGFAIILFTLAIKIITFPLTIKQIQGMQAQKELQPKIQELQKKYGKDRERLSQEQMKLYREAGVNPLSGCLPLLIQMPILFGLYSALIAIGGRLQDASFFWIPDLGFPSYTETAGSPSWIMDYFSQGRYGEMVAYLVLPILLMASQFIMQKWMTPTSTGGDQNQMAGMTQQIGLMMTLMFGFFTLTVPAGLTLYWVTSNLLQMLQQWITTDERFGIAGKPAVLATSAGTLSANGASGTAKSDGKTIDATPLPVAADADQPAKPDKTREIRRRRSKRR
jgi:YidC/Oxa1 family membrane protein insertase